MGSRCVASSGSGANIGVVARYGDLVLSDTVLASCLIDTCSPYTCHEVLGDSTLKPAGELHSRFQRLVHAEFLGEKEGHRLLFITGRVDRYVLARDG